MDVIYSVGYISICMRSREAEIDNSLRHHWHAIDHDCVSPLSWVGPPTLCVIIFSLPLYSTRAIASIRRGNRSSAPTAIIGYVWESRKKNKKEKEKKGWREGGVNDSIPANGREYVVGVRNDSPESITHFDWADLHTLIFHISSYSASWLRRLSSSFYLWHSKRDCGAKNPPQVSNDKNSDFGCMNWLRLYILVNKNH